EAAHLCQRFPYGVRVRRTQAEKVRIPGRPVRRIEPQIEEQRALEPVVIARGTYRKPTEKSLEAVTVEREVEILAARLRQRQQPRLERRGSAAVHATASRYGRMTFATRLTCA